MGLLERLRPQPKWRHADAAVRAAGVAEIPLDDLDTLAELARQDPDARVRRACVDRLEDPRLLAEVAQSDGDQSVRDAAMRALVDTAIGEYEGAAEPASLAALEGIGDVKALAEVAKRSAFETVGRSAASRITDEKTLASIARRAVHVSTRVDALARVTAPEDLDAIALRTEFKDVALAALDRIDGRDRLDLIAERAKSKAAARAARARVRDLDEAERVRAAEDEARQAQARAAAAEVVARAESIAAERDVDRLRERLTAVEREWTALAAPDENLRTRFDRAITAARRTSDEIERDAVARRERDAELAGGIAGRTAVVERLEALDESASDEEMAAIERAWAALPPLAGHEAEVLEQRFAGASAAARQRREQTHDREARRARFESLLAEAEGLGLGVADPLADDPARGPLGARVARFKEIRRDWLAAAQSLDADLAERFQTLQAGIDAARAHAREAREAREREQIDRLRRDVERLERQAGAEPLSLKLADRTLREVRAALDHSADHRPTAKEHGELVARLKALQGTLVPKVTELRELDDWQRWANVEVQEKLCARIEALKDATDLEVVARELRSVQEEWRAAASVPRQHAQALWHRYKTAYDQAYARCEAYFAQQNAARAENLRRKEELCARAESLAESHDWVATADILKGLQAEWKTIGPVPRGHEKSVWDRFQKACDRFFTRRHEDLAHRKAMWGQNLARKEALCARAEALADSTEWDSAASEIKALQNEWKTIGPVKKSRSDAIWHRFRAACDRFFERYKHRHQLEIHSRIESREQLLAELDTLAGEAAAGAPEDLGARVNGLYTRWLHAPPLPREHAAAAQERFTSALDRLVSEHPAAFTGTVLDAHANRRRLDQLAERVEKLLPAQGQPDEATASPTERLATMLREALAANTIGGRVDEDARWRAAADEVRDAQAAWSRVGYVPESIRRPLQHRFERASRRVMELANAKRAPVKK